MTLLQRYIFRRALVLSAATFVSLLAIVWTTQVLTRINIATESSSSTAAFLALAAYLMPKLVPIVLPFSILIGVISALNAMSQDSELTVMNAAGVSRTHLVLPALLIALTAGFYTFASNHLLEPWSNRQVQQVLATRNVDLVATLVQPGVFANVDQGLTLYVRDKRAGGDLEGVFIADQRSPDIELLYYARLGSIKRIADLNLLVLNDGELHRRVRETGETSIIRYTAYAFDLSKFTASGGEPSYSAEEQYTPYLLSPAEDDTDNNRNPGAYVAELHKRMTDWLYPVAFALIAVIGAGQSRSNRADRFNGIVVTFLVALVLRWLGFVAFNLTRKSPDLFPLIHAVPVTILVLAWLFLRYDLSLKLPDRIVDRLGAFAERLTRAGSTLRASLPGGRP